MITQLNTYEGVPIGGNNFEDFLAYIRGFLGANFGFSTNLLQNQGGYFEDDDFEYLDRSAPPYDATFFVPNPSKPSGSLFGKYGNDFYRFEVLSVDGPGEEPQTYKWVLLATDSEDESGLFFSTTSEKSEENWQLPFKPVRKNPNLSTYSYGYHEIRFNGIIQDEFDYFYDQTQPSLDLLPVFPEQTLDITRLRLGAESPSPVSSGRYDNFMSDPEEGVTRDVFETDYDSTVSFEHTNFSIDLGAHIVLHRRDGNNNRYAYIPQDLSSGESVSPGHFKVLDFSRGTIKLNITNPQLQELVFVGEDIDVLSEEVNFVVASFEQLKEEFIGGVGHYYTRYGEVYDGVTSDVSLLEYIFDGNQNVIREIPESDYFSGIGALLLQDSNRRYSDGVILAAQYYAIPDSSKIETVQSTRYVPDTLQLYYSVGIIKELSAFPNSQIRAVVQINPSSWYNRDVLDGDYFPVNRVDEAYYSLIHVTEVTFFSLSTVFDPNSSFQIVDTVGLESLSDVGPISNNQVLVYNSTTETFDGVDYALSALTDVSFSNVTNLNVIQRIGSSWQNRTLTQVMTSQLLAGYISYDSTRAAGIPAESDNNILVTKGYVLDEISAAATSGGSALANHISDEDGVHGSTHSIVSSKLVQRDVGGRAEFQNPSIGHLDGIFTGVTATNVKQAVNYDWLMSIGSSNNQFNSDSALVPQAANKIARRDALGYLYARTPSTESIANANGRRLNTVATKGYVDAKSPIMGSADVTLSLPVMQPNSVMSFETSVVVPENSVFSISYGNTNTAYSITARRNSNTGRIWLTYHLSSNITVASGNPTIRISWIYMP